ncbi:ABC transporter permease subunit [Actinoplanes hulinensis]|uniref:ABC transporter permease subunit n=1 Tax=Actinoplanes hulinensis TaxID=1144547 RepID=UPI001FE2797F|nr:ABC transporter permease [Actinoplanes hulinensis]
MPTSRRRLLIGAAGAAFLAGCGGTESGASAGSAPGTLRIGYQRFGGLSLSKARGDAPDAEWSLFESGPALTEALKAGAIDIGQTGEAPPIFAALGSFFPLYFNTYAGIRDIDQRLVEAAKTCGLNQWERLRHVVLPGALPSLFLGLRLAIGAGWLSLVVGEQVNAQTGIGFLMMEAREFAQTDVVVFGLLVYAALGLLSDTLIRIAERRTLAWRRGLQAT